MSYGEAGDKKVFGSRNSALNLHSAAEWRFKIKKEDAVIKWCNDKSCSSTSFSNSSTEFSLMHEILLCKKIKIKITF